MFNTLSFSPKEGITVFNTLSSSPEVVIPGLIPEVVIPGLIPEVVNLEVYP